MLRYINRICLSVLLALICCAFINILYGTFYHNDEDVKVTITALGKNNAAAHGDEITLVSVIVDGRSYTPAQLFPSGFWTTKKDESGTLNWNSYTQGLKHTIEGSMPTGKKLELKFITNRWSGIVRISTGSKEKLIDLYSDKPYDLKNIEIGKQRASLDLWELSGVFICFVALFYSQGGKIKNSFFNCIDKFYKPTQVCSKSERHVYLDLMRCVCIFMIVLIHTSVGSFEDYGKQGWWGFAFINSLNCFAVPCFFMISGSLILNKNKKIFEHLQNLFVRLLIPLFVWSVIYIFFKRYYMHADLSFFKQILSIYKEPQYYHLWFIYSLAGLYFMAPLLRVILRNAKQDELIYLAAFLCLLPMLIANVEFCFGVWSQPSKFFWGYPEIVYFLGGYFVIAYFQSLDQVENKVFAATAILSCFIIFILTCYSSRKLGAPVKYYFHESSFLVFFYAVSVFCFFYCMRERLQSAAPAIKKIIFSISHVSMGIYYIHMFFVEYIKKVNIDFIAIDVQDSSISSVLLATILCMFLSYIVCILLSRIRFVRKLV